MTDVGSSPPDTSRAAYGTERHSTGWTGWIVFAAFLMFMNGGLGMLQGLMALVNDDYYAVSSTGLAVSVDYTAWGWVHLVLGAALFACGMGILAGNLAARIVGVLLAGLHAVVALLFIEAAPGWGVLSLLVSVLVIFALTVHGREMRDFA